MSAHLISIPATDENFSEEAYLKANPDIVQAVKEGISLKSGKQHYKIFGKAEQRHVRLPISAIAAAKIEKLKKIEPLLRYDMPYILPEGYLYNFLGEDLRVKYNIVATEAVSSNNYGTEVLEIIQKLDKGWILDCGAGRRDIYYDNVVNLEIVDYDTTDVLGVGEKLPFKDEVFDCVLSLSVLEHVKDPFLCAREIARVLKPGGTLICSVPFLQPYHGYPNHYYNMTAQGLKNLFSNDLEIDKVDVGENELPVWSLTWILQNWVKGLEGETRENFLQMKIADLIDSGDKYIDKDFVTKLPPEKNFELAYATLLFAHKKP